MDIRNLGNFANIEAVWASYPNGGIEGDYLFIPNEQGVKYRWNKYIQKWENAAVVTETTGRQAFTVSDLHVQNEVHVASHADVQGDLRVQGVLRAAHVKQPNVGLFATLAALQAAYPSPEVGMWATVGDSVPGYVYRCNTAGTWTATGGTGGVDDLENVVLHGEQSLTDAQKKQARQNLGFGNGDFATGSDFDNPDSTKRAKIPTVGAIMDNIGDVPDRLATIEDELGIPYKSTLTDNVGVIFSNNGMIRTRYADGHEEGSVGTSTLSKYSQFVNIAKYSKLDYTRMISTAAASYTVAGLCFYTEANESSFISGSGIPYQTDGAEKGYVQHEIAVPEGAQYVRFSCFNEYVENFVCEGIYTEYIYSDGLGKEVNNLREELSEVQQTLYPEEIRINPTLCRRRFYLAMTEWCKNHGIANAIIEGAGGFGAGGEVENEVLGYGFANYSVADMAKILLTGYSYGFIANAMSELKHIAYAKGNERAIELDSGLVTNDNSQNLLNYYKVMAYKSGGGPSYVDGIGEVMPENSYCMSAICYHEDFDDCLVLGVVRMSSDNGRNARFSVFKQLMDVAKKRIQNEDITAADTNLLEQSDVNNAIAIKIPFGNPKAYHHVDFGANDCPYTLFAKNQNAAIYPMSMIKVLTAIVVLDYMKDLDVRLTITQEDRGAATRYSSAYTLFQGGEKLTIRDLLYASLLPSSNVANYVLARYVGQFLLETYDTNGFIPNN